MLKHTALLFLSLLGACASPVAERPAAPQTEGAAVSQAAVTPLKDLNLVHGEIPAVLLAAQKAPYAPPADTACAALVAEVSALDAALGADLDTPPTPNNAGLIERGASSVGSAATGALRGAAEGIVPFRGWIRKLTGAERYSNQVAAAIAAGTVRRAYLKGLGQAGGCRAPAAPLR